MRSIIPVLLVASMTLGGCAVVRNSVVNPANWFGRGDSVPVSGQEAQAVNPLIPQSGGLFGSRAKSDAPYAGRPIAEIIDLQIERVAGGAIVRATGRAARQGIYAVQLTPATEDDTPVDGVLIYRLEGIRQAGPTAVGTAPTREVTAARHITDSHLLGVRAIRVEGLENARVARR